MSKIFFEELEIPEPDFNLGIHGGSHSRQVAGIMTAFEEVLLEEKPDLVLVPGDVNSTMAATLVASKMGIRVGHIESGLRSFDRTMPEEINRMVTDILADMLFVSEPSGLKNLQHEGIDEKKIHYVGNVMIDSLVHYLPKIERSEVLQHIDGTTSFAPGGYVLCTFHRPSNVDDPAILRRLLAMLRTLPLPVLFPVHPRTRKNMERQGLLQDLPAHLHLTDPIGYVDFLALVKNAALVITDSGGIQEETTFLGVQCITVRDNTERPVTVVVGTNQLIGTDFDKVEKAALKVLGGEKKNGRIPGLWDGHTAERIVEIVIKELEG
jgi:UDP-N-acetylglucosamine 2-epimerase (non-hydrolysing)